MCPCHELGSGGRCSRYVDSASGPAGRDSQHLPDVPLERHLSLPVRRHHSVVADARVHYHSAGKMRHPLTLTSSFGCANLTISDLRAGGERLVHDQADRAAAVRSSRRPSGDSVFQNLLDVEQVCAGLCLVENASELL